MDPILNPVLNREYTHTGGRTLIRLGNEDIDFSPKFVCVLLTRTPSPKFAPDLCSRVTVVNFTVTPASLEAQVRWFCFCVLLQLSREYCFRRWDY